jgi:hypothetical protein
MHRIGCPKTITIVWFTSRASAAEQFREGAATYQCALFE